MRRSSFILAVLALSNLAMAATQLATSSDVDAIVSALQDINRTIADKECE